MISVRAEVATVLGINAPFVVEFMYPAFTRMPAERVGNSVVSNAQSTVMFVSGRKVRVTAS